MKKNKSLAVKHRPATFADVMEQDSIKLILENQIKEGDIPPGLLFSGPSGDGKTTLARIFSNVLNRGEGHPIEIDAASNNGVDNIRSVIEEAKLRSLDCDYKVFIVDEAHMLSIGAWNALLKTLEEPPAGTLFIFCTTEPKKVPLTILSRVQRFDFKRISYQGIMNRLYYILGEEIKENPGITYDAEAIEFIAKLADGGMRRGITMLDKCLGYSNHISYTNACNTLGVTPYDKMFDLVTFVLNNKVNEAVNLIDTIYLDGADLKQFISDYVEFLLDVIKFQLTSDYDKISIPPFYDEKLKNVLLSPQAQLKKLLFDSNEILANIKREDKPKFIITLGLMSQCEQGVAV